MATRSSIGIYNNGKVTAVYAHWDGYPEHNGKILLENYDESKLRELLALGDVSVLGPEIGEKHDFNEGVKGWTTFFGRDRGEEDTASKVFDDDQELFDYYDSEYFYVLKDGVWFVSEGKGAQWKVLREVL